MQFTWEWITNVENNSVNADDLAGDRGIETPDELTAVVTFKSPSATWFEPFTGGVNGHILPAHSFNDEPISANNPDFLLYPIGTGPFVITEFVPNDRVALTMNENYREPNKPYFSSIAVKGGGDAPSAARAVLQTGDYDYAWNLQVEPAILLDLAGVEALGEANPDAPGMLVSEVGTSVERIHINFSDPNAEVDGQRSEINTPHPFLTDPAVRQALNKAVPRQLIMDEFYGLAARTTPEHPHGPRVLRIPEHVLGIQRRGSGPDPGRWLAGPWMAMSAPRTACELVISYGTSINAGAAEDPGRGQAGVREHRRQGQPRPGRRWHLLRQWRRQRPQCQPQLLGYLDVHQQPGVADSGVVLPLLVRGWTTTMLPSRAMAGRARTTSGTSTPDFDALYDKLVTLTSLEEAGQKLIEMNDILINDVAVIPEVNRPADTYAISQNARPRKMSRLRRGFEQGYWNVANWRTV